MSDMGLVELVASFPDAPTYRRLRIETGLSPKSQEAAERGLANTLYGVSLLQALTSRGERSMGKPGFFTLRGVLALFSNPKAVLAAWIHILAFDLMVGLYIQQQGAAQGIGHLWLVPCYLMAMMFGPLGLLLFLGVSLLH